MQIVDSSRGHQPFVSGEAQVQRNTTRSQSLPCKLQLHVFIGTAGLRKMSVNHALETVYVGA